MQLAMYVYISFKSEMFLICLFKLSMYAVKKQSMNATQIGINITLHSPNYTP